MNYIAIKDIVRSVSQTHKFEKDYLKAVNTSDVFGGELLDVPYSETTSLKGQFKKTIQFNDILFSEIRPANRRFGRVNIKDTADYVVSTKLMVLRKFNEDVDLDYFYYCLTNQSFLETLQRRAENRIGSFPQITFDLLGDYRFPIPTLAEQKRIASVIANIDSKIRINREINRNLEAMARQLYDYWFVQFDFPDENGKPYKSSGGKMVWNEKIKREIPEGWDCMNIGNYAQCKGGYAFKSKDFGNEGLPVIKIGNIHEDYTLSMADCLKVTGLYNHQFTTNKYDLVIAMTGATIGKFAISPSKYWVNQRVGRFDLGDRPLERLGYLFNSLKQQYFRKQVFQIAGGCAQPNISNDQIDSILILKPTDILLDKYNKTCMPLLRLLIKNILEIELLIEKRDTLLPLLMNGQVSVMPSEVNCDLSHG
ncbi:restriction endonuclease subunit S [Sangeribacter muris]|uniref:restriction endonuclease subunit S n=1 Tax=Sangeribacter muris TaxID=2880703 RepID=UPI00244DDDCA|nr:restriction endonuclease subunit S [Sangeribacter muris]